MKYSPEQIEEANTLLLFNTENFQDGIKIHSDATPEVISAVKRLFDKGLITQTDGGYLSDAGRKAAEHAHSLFGLLKQ